MAVTIKDFPLKKSYTNLIEEKLFSYIWEGIYKPMFDILDTKPKVARNSINAVTEALRDRKIYYVDGGFKANGKFSSAISLQLKKWGAVYDKWQKMWRIPKNMIPDEVRVTLAQSEALNASQLRSIDNFLKEVQTNIPDIVDSMIFDNEVKTILDDAENEIKKNVKHLNVITPELTPQQKQEIARTYTNNLKEYVIKDFGDERIPEMRRKVQEAVLNGQRRDDVQKMLETDYGVASRKAKFLARNETGIMLAQYKKATYKGMGFDKFIWNTIMDGKERQLHADLNGTTWSYDDPPIIDERTGRHGLPGETYNCYHKDTEVLTKDGFKLIKDVRVGETIATLNPETKTWEWSICTHTIKQRANEIAILKSNIFELATSLNHTFFYYKRKYKGKQLIKNSEYPVFTTGTISLAKKNTVFYASSENWNKKNPDTICGIPTEVFCKFMGYYLSDGSFDKRSKNCIHLSQQDNEWMYKELNSYMHTCKGKDKLYIYNEQLFNLIKPLGNCHTKRIPESIKILDKKLIKVFLDSFVKCDGKKAAISNGFEDQREMNTYNQYFTVSPSMMADLVECIYKCGMSASVYTIYNKNKQIQFKNGLYKLNYDLFIVQEMKTLNRDLNSMNIDVQPYNDFVYDIEVEKNHTLLIKSGKSIHWNSNCRCQALPYRSDSPFKMDTQQFNERQSKKRIAPYERELEGNSK